MKYDLFSVVGAVPPRNLGTLQKVGVTEGTFSPATFQGWNKFFGPNGWQEGNTFVYYTLETLKAGDVLQVKGKAYKVTGGAEGRIRNTYFLVKNA